MNMCAHVSVFVSVSVFALAYVHMSNAVFVVAYMHMSNSVFVDAYMRMSNAVLVTYVHISNAVLVITYDMYMFRTDHVELAKLSEACPCREIIFPLSSGID